MHPAPVGFQCPECVGQARAQAAPQLARAQRRGAVRALAEAPATAVLIAINVLVWASIMLTGGGDSPLVNALALQDTALCVVGAAGYFGVTAAQCAGSGGILFPGVADGAPWQLVTSMFTHVQVFHIGLNMVALWFIGVPLERLLGRTRFLLLYLLGGLAGSVAVYWLASPNGQTLGASGAIFGLMGGLLVIVLRRGGDYRNVLMWLGINIVFTFAGGAGISWQGHLGGLAGGILVTLILLRDRVRITPATWLLLGSYTLALVALTGLRTLQLA